MIWKGKFFQDGLPSFCPSISPHHPCWGQSLSLFPPHSFMLGMFSASQALLFWPLQVLSDNFSPLNPSLDLHSTNLLLLSRLNPWGFSQKQGKVVVLSRSTAKYQIQKAYKKEVVKNMKETTVFLLLTLQSHQSRMWTLVRAWLTCFFSQQFILNWHSEPILGLYECTQL